jgi:hypothetical protein
MGSLANSTLPAEVVRAKSNEQNPSVSNDDGSVYRCGRMASGRLGSAPTLGPVRIGLNMIHNPMGQNKVLAKKRSLHQNNDCSWLRHDMDLSFYAYESRLYELSRKYLHA